MDAWHGRKVLVTGAGGFIGSHLVENLVQAGAKVTALVKYNGRGSTGMLTALKPELLGDVEIVSGDIRDAWQMLRVVDGKDTVFHLAALIGIPYSYVAPQSYVDVNVHGTLNLLEAARRVGVRRFMHTSTSEVYGTALRVPIDEAHPLQPQSPYSASKISADAMAESFFRTFESPVVIVRPFNTYGPRQSTRAIIPTVISQALRGDVLKLGSLDPVRDMTFAADTARGMMMCTHSDACVGKTTNLGTGSAVSVGEIVEMVGKAMGKKFSVVTDAQRVRPVGSEVMKLVSDNQAALTRAGWKPLVGLEEGLVKTIEDLKARSHELVEGYHV